MSSKTVSDARWSLTSRMAFHFAATTSALIALYALWAAHFVYSSKMDGLSDFLEHEISEYHHMVALTSLSEAELIKASELIATVVEEPPCGFRIRDAEGVVLVERGDERLLALPEVGEASWRSTLLGSRAMSGTTTLGDPPLTLEVLADTSGEVEELKAFLGSAVLAFLVSVVLAGLAGWFTSRRGLRGLREVTRGARGIVFPSGGVSLNLEGAPTEVREVGVALEDMIRRIDEGLQSMRDFTAGLANELRSPLPGLIGRTEDALMQQRDVSSYENTLRGNLDDLHALSDSVDNMVTICRSATPNRSAYTSERFDLAEEAQMRLERERRSAERSGISVELEIAGDTNLTADREGCLRVVRNLVSNAVKWSHEGGVVRVEIKGRPAYVEVDVTDEGPGIPEEMAQKMYDAFVSGAPRHGRRSGYGLGLAICKAAVDDHGGSISFENRSTGGARFQVKLPREPVPALEEGPVTGRSEQGRPVATSA